MGGKREQISVFHLTIVPFKCGFKLLSRVCPLYLRQILEKYKTENEFAFIFFPLIVCTVFCKCLIANVFFFFFWVRESPLEQKGTMETRQIQYQLIFLAN